MYFTPSKWFLVHGKDDRFGDNGGNPVISWWLAPRIDRSEKGKDDDLGIPTVYLTDYEAETCRKAGFTKIEYRGE